MGDKNNIQGKPERLSGFEPNEGTSIDKISDFDLVPAYSTLIKAFLRARASGNNTGLSRKEADDGQKI